MGLLTASKVTVLPLFSCYCHISCLWVLAEYFWRKPTWSLTIHCVKYKIICYNWLVVIYHSYKTGHHWDALIFIWLLEFPITYVVYDCPHKPSKTILGSSSVHPYKRIILAGPIGYLHSSPRRWEGQEALIWVSHCALPLTVCISALIASGLRKPRIQSSENTGGVCVFPFMQLWEAFISAE